MKRFPALIALLICWFLSAQMAYAAHAAEHPFHKNTISCEKFSTANDPTGGLIDANHTFHFSVNHTAQQHSPILAFFYLVKFNTAQPRAPPP